MKFIVVFMLCVALAHGELSKEFKEKIRKEFNGVVKKCAKQEKASTDDVIHIMGGEDQIPDTIEGKCLIACFHQELEAQGKDGKFTKEGLIASMKLYKAEDEVIYNKIIKVFVEVCLPKIKSTDRCEAAAEMYTCYRNNADEDIKDV